MAKTKPTGPTPVDSIKHKDKKTGAGNLFMVFGEPDIKVSPADDEGRPFTPPETGKIAVKVINHYGDEVLKVYEL